MSGELTADTDGVLNEVTNTVHKREPGGSEYETACGVTNHVTHDDLRGVRVERATGTDASKCGRCFRGAGGY
ncbi:MAG: hypothetical protein ABEJ85_04770, partial [Haloarculaceae archaeon]